VSFPFCFDMFSIVAELFLTLQTPWEGGVYKVQMLFPDGVCLVFQRSLCLALTDEADYPIKPPKCASRTTILFPRAKS
jgi:ubiquitin-protein ligase